MFFKDTNFSPFYHQFTEEKRYETALVFQELQYNVQSKTFMRISSMHVEKYFEKVQGLFRSWRSALKNCYM
jgi:hypothetical protein